MEQPAIYFLIFFVTSGAYVARNGCVHSTFIIVLNVCDVFWLKLGLKTTGDWFYTRVASFSQSEHVSIEGE